MTLPKGKGIDVKRTPLARAAAGLANVAAALKMRTTLKLSIPNQVAICLNAQYRDTTQGNSALVQQPSPVSQNGIYNASGRKEPLDPAKLAAVLFSDTINAVTNSNSANNQQTTTQPINNVVTNSKKKKRVAEVAAVFAEYNALLTDVI